MLRVSIYSNSMDYYATQTFEIEDKIVKITLKVTLETQKQSDINKLKETYPVAQETLTENFNRILDKINEIREFLRNNDLLINYPSDLYELVKQTIKPILDKDVQLVTMMSDWKEEEEEEDP